MRIITASALLASFADRSHSVPEPGIVTLTASAEEQKPETINVIQAMAVKGFAQVSGPLQYVQATEHFFAAGEPVYAGDFVQLTSEDAKRLVNAGRAELASDDDVAAAQKATKGK